MSETLRSLSTLLLVWGIFIGCMFLPLVFVTLKHYCTTKEPKIEAADRVQGGATFLGRITRELEKPIRFSPKEIAVATNHFSTKLGSGGYGDVYKGVLFSKDGSVQVAVKALKDNGLIERVEEQFIAEVGSIGRTYHKHLVRLLGYCFDGETKALVFEYMENGSLDSVLFNEKQNIEWGKLYKIAIEAAKGLEYLHHFGRERIIHYDIKPANILLDCDFSAKLGDFGLAKLCNKTNTHITFSRFKGTPGYAAPELYLGLSANFKCDVYSFGITLFEILGRRKNLGSGNTSSESQDCLANWFPKIVWEKFDKGELEELMVEIGIEEGNMNKAKRMAMVALWCIQHLPQERPSMSSVVRILEIETEVINPPNPFQHLLSSNIEVPRCIERSLISSSNATSDDGSSKSATTPLMKKYEIEILSAHV